MIPARWQPVLDEVRPLADAFSARGHSLYLVGGVVRDLLAGRDHPGGHPDIDLTTEARPDEIQAVLAPLADALWDQGARYGTIGAKVGGRTFEVTTHRADSYDPDSRKPTVTFGDDIVADLSRRDFTVNAMAVRLRRGDTAEPELIDPFDGATDLLAGRLRTPQSPDVAFTDDPLRMLRAARFVAGYHLEPDAELVAAVRRHVDRLTIVSAERIRDELDKLLVVADPSAGLWFVVDTGLAEGFLPELSTMRLEQDPIHRHKDVLAHTIAVVAKTQPERIVRLAALLHDVGKPKTRSIGPNGVSFHHHEVVGARMARDRMQALRYPADDVDVVRRLVYLHLRFHTYAMGWTDAAVRRFVRDAGDHLERLIELTRCDVTTRNKAKAERLARRMDELEARIIKLRATEELRAMRPDLDGRQVMDHLGVGPGRHVGDALAALLELRLDKGPLGEEEAYRRLDLWWADQTRSGPPAPS
ncbi:MAG: CCA tRNA nucleotidyltransferase [Acidimicrobiales bacterium]